MAARWITSSRERDGEARAKFVTEPLMSLVWRRRHREADRTSKTLEGTYVNSRQPCTQPSQRT
jgi:hypothetical protein